MKLQATDTFVVRRKCENCNGEGRLSKLWCDKCAGSFGPNATLTSRALPCGHSAVHLKQTIYNCSACCNQGYTDHAISIADLLLYIVVQRQKYLPTELEEPGTD